MELNYTAKKCLLLLLLINFSSAQELCKNGRCRVDLSSLDNKKVSKEIKRESSATKVNRNKKINEKVTIKLSVK